VASNSGLALESDRMRRIIIIVLAISIAVIFLLTMSNRDNMYIKSMLPVTITAGIAMTMCIHVALRERMVGLFGKTYAALAIGMVCWFVGEAIWSYESIQLGKGPTELSIAEIPWLVLFAFFGYYIFHTYCFFARNVNRYYLILVLGLASILVVTTEYYSLIAFEQNTQGLQQTMSILAAIVRLSYPIGDAVLIVPSILLLITLRHGLMTYTPWLFISLGLIFICAADFLFSNIALLGEMDLGLIAYPLYSAGNIAFTGGLIWYARFGILEKNKTQKAFQEENR